jgi:hypothetical protein
VMRHPLKLQELMSIQFLCCLENNRGSFRFWELSSFRLKQTTWCKIKSNFFFRLIGFLCEKLWGRKSSEKLPSNWPIELVVEEFLDYIEWLTFVLP